MGIHISILVVVLSVRETRRRFVALGVLKLLGEMLVVVLVVEEGHQRRLEELVEVRVGVEVSLMERIGGMLVVVSVMELVMPEVGVLEGVSVEVIIASR
jgi:hypothetical protein